MHPVEPRAAGFYHRLFGPVVSSVDQNLAMNEPEKPFKVGPPAGTVSENNRMARRRCGASGDCPRVSVPKNRR